MSVPPDPHNQYPALLAPLATSLLLKEWVTVSHVLLAPSTTCLLRRPAFPVAAPPPHQQVGYYQMFPDISEHIKSLYLTKYYVYFLVLNVSYSFKSVLLKHIYFDHVAVLCHTCLLRFFFLYLYC